jgi:hypothetical protein
MENKLFQLLTQYGRILQKNLFPRLEDELGPLTDKHRQVVTVLGLANVEAFIPWRGVQAGRPPQDRAAIARAFVAKAICNLPTTRVLIDVLKADTRLRRICGWERASQVPDETVFSRAFAEFARAGLPERVHEALIVNTQKERLIGHISRDSTAVEARERPAKRSEKAQVAKPPKQRRKRGEPKPVEDMTRIERQGNVARLQAALGCGRRADPHQLRDNSGEPARQPGCHPAGHDEFAAGHQPV